MRRREGDVPPAIGDVRRARARRRAEIDTGDATADDALERPDGPSQPVVGVAPVDVGMGTRRSVPEDPVTGRTACVVGLGHTTRPAPPARARRGTSAALASPRASRCPVPPAAAAPVRDGRRAAPGRLSVAGRGRRGGGRPAVVRAASSIGPLELEPDPRRRGGRTLLIDGLVHGYVDLDDPAHLEVDYVARIGAALEVLVPRGAAARVLHLGGGAFSLPRFLAATRPQVEQTVVERSAAIVRLAEQHLRLRRTDRLRVVVADAARAVRRFEDGAFDLVLGDAFVGTETPDALTGAFADEVRRLLAPGGRYLWNVVDQPPWPVAAAELAALQERFAHVTAFGGREVVRGRHAGNLLLLASATPLPLDALARRIAGGAHPAELLAAGRLAALADGAG